MPKTVLTWSPNLPGRWLPPELVYSIVKLLTPEEFIAFAIACYPLLRDYGLVPVMTAERLESLTRTFKRPARLLPFPSELIVQIMRKLKPIDQMGFVLANYPDLALKGIAPALTVESLRRLRHACVDG